MTHPTTNPPIDSPVDDPIEGTNRAEAGGRIRTIHPSHSPVLLCAYQGLISYAVPGDASQATSQKLFSKTNNFYVFITEKY